MTMTSEVKPKSVRGIPPGRGPYGVGCVDVMTGLSTSGIFFRLFYPTDKSADGLPQNKRPSWLPGDQRRYAKGYGSVVGSKLVATVLKWLVGKFSLPATWHAPLSKAKDKFPVVVFSHGLGGCRTTYTSICIDIASCGCVVAAVEHRDRSACCTFVLNDSNSNKTNNAANAVGGESKQETQWIDYHQAPYDDPELRSKQVNQRKDECIAVLDYLQDMNEGTELDNDLDEVFDATQFQGRLDMNDVAVCGHSFGGATTIACLSRDSRFKCGVGFDVWMYPLHADESFLNINQPLIFVNTETFHWPRNMEQIRRLIDDPYATTGPRQMITILGTVHQSQSDFGLLLRPFVAKMGKMRGELDPHVAMAINNDAAIKFLSDYISLDVGDQLDGFASSSKEHVIIGPAPNIKDEGKKDDEAKDATEKEEGKETSKTGEEDVAKTGGEDADEVSLDKAKY